MGREQEQERVMVMFVPSAYLVTPFRLTSHRFQSQVTRNEVRKRDQKCRVLGQHAHTRTRGTNFVGLEVAHIYPIGWVDKVSISNH